MVGIILRRNKADSRIESVWKWGSSFRYCGQGWKVKAPEKVTLSKNLKGRELAMSVSGRQASRLRVS